MSKAKQREPQRTVSGERLDDGNCPFCGESIDGAGKKIQFDDDGEIREDQNCETCGAHYRVFYGPIGIVRGEKWLPAVRIADTLAAGIVVETAKPEPLPESEETRCSESHVRRKSES